jgi:hypothetical protein
MFTRMRCLLPQAMSSENERPILNLEHGNASAM